VVIGLIIGAIVEECVVVFVNETEDNLSILEVLTSETRVQVNIFVFAQHGLDPVQQAGFERGTLPTCTRWGDTLEGAKKLPTEAENHRFVVVPKILSCYRQVLYLIE
jgi:hypothetical protein